MSDKLVTQGLRRLLVERYGQTSGFDKEWALFFELPNGTGARGDTRYVDAFALNLWPSKKFWRIAWELKASRADFLRELEKPHKRQWGFEVSNEFWYLCAAGVAKPEEIPEGCGLLVANEDLTKLRKVKPAPHRNARELTINDVASFARQSTQPLDLLFQYAGRELDSAALRELLTGQMDEHMNALVRERVSAEVERQLQAASRLLNSYAGDMRKAGISPPGWMEAPSLKSLTYWDAADWARKELVPRTGQESVAEAKEEADRMVRELQRAVTRAEAARDALAKLERRLPTIQGISDDDLS
jgi:hypothetical protein